ncbi:MAG: hypothetical protein IPL13_17470 [Saprospiraceae bacterium]|nr:hypothetical protein [Candidatus Brachybacter algidus]
MEPFITPTIYIDRNPHTSNWDFQLGLLTRVLSWHINFVGKDTPLQMAIWGNPQVDGGYPVRSTQE